MKRDKIIEIAKSQVGTKESPPNSNMTIYGKWYGLNGFAWCAMFVSWVYDQAGCALGRIDDDKGYRDCRSSYNHWKATGEFTRDPEPGDIVLFDWTNDGKCDHTGIFNAWIDAAKTKFSAYEGNTALGNDSDGGQVMFRQDRKTASVRAFVKPKVLTGEAPPPLPPVISRNDRGADISTVQKQLTELGYKVVVDGHYGPETEKAIKKFQLERKLPVTGVVTAALQGSIESALIPTRVGKDKIITGAFLRKGDSGAAVVDLQAMLNKAGVSSKLEEDGIFGDSTRSAVMRFQEKKGLKVDGIAGPQTIAALIRNS